MMQTQIADDNGADITLLLASPLFLERLNGLHFPWARSAIPYAQKNWTNTRVDAVSRRLRSSAVL